MAEDVRIWEVLADDSLSEVTRAKLDLEERIETWMTKDPSILADDLLVIGRQVPTDYGGWIDLLCLDRKGDVVIVELKRDKTPREITAQALDYASWVKDLSHDRITEIAASFLGSSGPLENAFQTRFGTELPEVLNAQHRMLIVASEIDASSERIIRYLSETYGVGINAATFRYYRDAAHREFLARVFVIKQSQAEQDIFGKGSTKRKPYLTMEEMRRVAEDNGVLDLYQPLLDGLTPNFDYRAPTKTKIGFHGRLGGSMVVLFNLVPSDSGPTQGLRWNSYTDRLAKYLGVKVDDLLALLPKPLSPWVPWQSADSEYTGHEGFFQDIHAARGFILDISNLKAGQSVPSSPGEGVADPP